MCAWRRNTHESALQLALPLRARTHYEPAGDANDQRQTAETKEKRQCRTESGTMHHASNSIGSHGFHDIGIAQTGRKRDEVAA